MSRTNIYNKNGLIENPVSVIEDYLRRFVFVEKDIMITNVEYTYDVNIDYIDVRFYDLTKYTPADYYKDAYIEIPKLFEDRATAVNQVNLRTTWKIIESEYQTTYTRLRIQSTNYYGYFANASDLYAEAGTYGLGTIIGSDNLFYGYSALINAVDFGRALIPLNYKVHIWNIQGSNKIDVTNFDEVSALRKDWKVRKQILNQEAHEKILGQLLFECQLVLVQVSGKYKLIPYDECPTVNGIWELPLNSSQTASAMFSLKYTDVTSLFSEYDIAYNYHYGKKDYLKKVEVTGDKCTTGLEQFKQRCKDVITNYKYNRKYQYQYEWISDNTTALKSLSNIVKWHTKRRAIIEWWGGFKDCGKYEKGDFIQINNTYLLPNSLENAIFMITGKTIYTNYGDPKIKFELIEVNNMAFKVLTGTTSDTEWGHTSVAHGLDSTKINFIVGDVKWSTGAGMPNSHGYNAGYQFDIEYNTTVVKLLLHATNSENILSKPFKITICYEV